MNESWKIVVMRNGKAESVTFENSELDIGPTGYLVVHKKEEGWDYSNFRYAPIVAMFAPGAWLEAHRITESSRGVDKNVD